MSSIVCASYKQYGVYNQISIPYYEKFMGLNFEIQVKTLLDFAWQEIEHDRAYKTSAQFPKKKPDKKKV
jgi:putative GTP pyrophosphokinase